MAIPQLWLEICSLSKVVGLVEGLLPLTIYICLIYLAALGWYQSALANHQDLAICTLAITLSIKTRYMYFGGDGKDYLNDLHILDVNKMKWLSEEQAAVSGDLPSRRANHSSAVVGENSVYLGVGMGKSV